MNQKILDRLMTAGAYQKKAIYALFPEKMSVHLDAIEKEIKAMAAETMETWLREKWEKDRGDGKNHKSNMDGDADNVKSRRDNFHHQSGAKKIDII